MIIIELIFNLAILIAVSVLSGFIEARWKRKTIQGAVLQGLLFGGTAIIGMLNPFVLSPGIIFDGRSVVLSLCALFFGPVAAIIAAVLATIYRLYLGGGGIIMGVSVIISATLIGLLFHRARRTGKTHINALYLYLLGLLVHIVMVGLMVAIPTEMRFLTFKTVSITVLIVYPLATVLIGKILKDQEDNAVLIDNLAESELRFRLLFDKAPLGYQSLDFDGNFIDVNQEWLDTFGYQREEVIGKWFGDFLAPEFKEEFRKRFPVFKAKGKIVSEFEMIHKNGNNRIVVFEGRIGNDLEGKFKQTHCILKDITEQKRIEEALKESEEKLRFALEGTNDGLWDVNMQTNTVYMSPRGCEILGFTEEEMSNNYDVWMKLVNPEDMEATQQALQEHLSGGKPVFIVEQRLLTKSGEWKWILTRGKVVSYDEAGNPLRITGTHTDISQRRLAEEELHQLNENLEQKVIDRTAQLEATNKELEAFSYSISHDLRAPLRGIGGFTQILLEEYRDKLDDEGKRYCAIIRENAKKMSHLIDDLLAFSRLSRFELQKSKIDMKNMVNSIYHEVTTPDQRKHIIFKLDEIQEGYGDPNMLRQVWTNLLSNAVKFSSKVEQPEIKVYCEQEEQKTVYLVKDNGTGFDMQYANKLFGVFQRLHTDAEFEGTGVGLAIVQRIILRHGGEVGAEGETDKGALFYFSLPKFNGT